MAGARGDSEFPLGKQRQNRTLHADHRADERIDDRAISENWPMFSRSPSRVDLTFSSSHSAAISAGLEIGQIARRQIPRLVEPDDRVMIGRRSGNSCSRRGRQRSPRCPKPLLHRERTPAKRSQGFRRTRSERWCAQASTSSCGSSVKIRCSEPWRSNARVLACSGLASRSGRPTAARNSVSPVRQPAVIDQIGHALERVSRSVERS
jgi:hypothetical protein